MNHTHNTDELPWWEAELPAIRARQHSYLNSRLPALSAEHEDLLNATLLSLTKYIRNNAETLPKSWFGHSPPENTEEAKRLHALAHFTLRRRIVDLFRKRMSLTSLSDPHNPIDVADLKAASLDKKMLVAKLLRVTISALDEISPEDRDLIALISEDDGIRKALNPRDRQRLHRARKKLKRIIASQMGAELEELLSSF
jgi:hypothetical protein